MSPASLRKTIASLGNAILYFRDYLKAYARRAYSQEGEDIVLERFLEDRQTGFYVDIGAHHPKRFSNTYLLYLRGWRGLNVDATPGSMSNFRQVRPRDINVEAAIGAGGKELTFYVFNEPALNTFDKELARKEAVGQYRIVREMMIRTIPLSELLDTYLPQGVNIDVLSIDTEGLDYEVLCSNDWSRFRPEYVLVECFGAQTITDALAHPACQLLAKENYVMVAKTMSTVIFRQVKAAP